MADTVFHFSPHQRRTIREHLLSEPQRRRLRRPHRKPRGHGGPAAVRLEDAGVRAPADYLTEGARVAMLVKGDVAIGVELARGRFDDVDATARR